MQVRDGRWVVAITCAACHSSTASDGRFVPGLSNADLNLASVMGERWPRGTVDVTGDGMDNPLRPSDLRPVALQSRLHHTGNLLNGRIARMVRIETLITEHLSFVARPPRYVPATIALYLESLADGLPRPRAEAPGAEAFEATCAGCHAGEGLAGPPVDAAIVGTDPGAVGSAARGTGGYRAPSLLGVADRRALLHDGSAEDLRALLALAPSSHAGHNFGADLPVEAREAMYEFLRAR
jgi:mono/diheme cytochrome c family protein